MIQGLYPIFDHWHKEGTLYIYSDPHFNDPELKEGINRPTADELVQKINSKVGRKDTIIFLGDICDTSYIKQIRGYKVLIMGNHDAGRTNYEHQKWTKVFDKDKYTRDEAVIEMGKENPNCRYTISEGCDFHAPFGYWHIIADNQLFDEVYEGPVMIGEKLILSHEPVNIPWAFNIHGHCHDFRHKNDKYHFNVCADVINYLPINMNQWMKEGHLAHINSIHRTTIDKATENKTKRGGKKIGQK